MSLSDHGDDGTVQIGFEAMPQGWPPALIVVGPKALLPDGIEEVPLAIDGSDAGRVQDGSFDTDDRKALSSSDDSPSAGTCDVARRGRLRPPLDADGTPNASYAVSPIR